MNEPFLLHELIFRTADRLPERDALTYKSQSLTYRELAAQVRQFAGGLMTLGLERGDRIAIYLEKSFETVVASFGAPAAGCVFVPINPLLKAMQVSHILRDCNVRVLVTSAERGKLLADTLRDCHDLRHVIVVGTTTLSAPSSIVTVEPWSALSSSTEREGFRVIDADMVGIFYTSGSTGQPKGVVLSHRNIVTGARSVASYLNNNEQDVLLAALPLSFDAGFSQLTTAFCVGARAVLLNYLMPKDVLTALERERVTGLTAVPPLWIQLAQAHWPQSIATHLRYFANTGGHMPAATLRELRTRLPRARPYLMYGLTEAFRATYLPPEQADLRPDSIGKAIPNAEVLVLRDDGSPCAANEPGQLVQRGALVALGYWNDPVKTAERFRPLPRRADGLVLSETAVYSGDIVRADEDGFLYFIGRRDDMIKTSGYRVSPNEIEEVVYAVPGVGECAALGVPHPTLGQAIVVVASAAQDQRLDVDQVLTICRERLPMYMVPARIELRAGALPRNPNGKIDRNQLADEFQNCFAGIAT